MPDQSKSTEKKELTAEEVSFRNDAIAKIRALQNENSRLKDNIGRRRMSQERRRVGSAGENISGLQRLGSKPRLPLS